MGALSRKDPLTPMVKPSHRNVEVLMETPGSKESEGSQNRSVFSVNRHKDVQTKLLEQKNETIPSDENISSGGMSPVKMLKKPLFDDTKAAAKDSTPKQGLQLPRNPKTMRKPAAKIVQSAIKQEATKPSPRSLMEPVPISSPHDLSMI